MDSNYWFYTLSAIPQTLAAMIALAAMFVVFKLDFISKEMKDSRIDLRRFILLVTSTLDPEIDPTEIHEIEPLNDADFLKLYEKGLNNLIPNDEFLGLGEPKYEKYKDEMQRIIKQEWDSLYPANIKRIFGYLNMKKGVLERLLLVKRESLFLLKLSLATIAFTISVSLSVLPNFNYFNGSWLLIYSIVFMALLSTLVTSVSVWMIAKK